MSYWSICFTFDKGKVCHSRSGCRDALIFTTVHTINSIKSVLAISTFNKQRNTFHPFSKKAEPSTTPQWFPLPILYRRHVLNTGIPLKNNYVAVFFFPSCTLYLFLPPSSNPTQVLSFLSTHNWYRTISYLIKKRERERMTCVWRVLMTGVKQIELYETQKKIAEAEKVYSYEGKTVFFRDQREGPLLNIILSAGMGSLAVLILITTGK